MRASLWAATLAVMAVAFEVHGAAIVLAPPQDPVLPPRSAAPACEPAAELFIITARDGDDLHIAALLWDAGVPPGTTVRFYWSVDTAEALADATRDAAAAGTSPLLAPAAPDAAWAAAILCREGPAEAAT